MLTDDGLGGGGSGWMSGGRGGQGEYGPGGGGWGVDVYKELSENAKKKIMVN